MPIRLLVCVAAALLCQACSPSRLGEDASIHVYDLSTGLKDFSLRGHNRPTTALAISADGQYVLTASMTRELRLWSLVERREIREIDPYVAQSRDGPGPHLGWGHSLKFVEGTQLALVGHEQAGFALWNLESNTVVRTFRTPFREASSVVISAEGTTVMAADAHQPVAVSWNLADGESRKVYAERWLGNSPYVGLAHDGHRPTWWHSETCEPLSEGAKTAAGPRARYSHHARLSPDGRRMVTYYATADNATNVCGARVWDLESRRLLWQRSRFALLTDHGRRSYSPGEAFAFSPDSRRLAVGLPDGTVEVRDVDEGNLVQEWSVPPKSCELVSFVPNGRQLLTWGASVMRLWEIETGTLIKSFDVPILRGMIPTGDGRWLVVGGNGQWPGL